MIVYCLCADWCRTCDAYRETFDALAQEWAGLARWVWVDIEENADAMGDVDVENFPTLLIANTFTHTLVDTPQVYFFGAVSPHAGVASRLLEQMVKGQNPPLSQPQWTALCERLMQSNNLSGLLG
ncbi:MAG: hypothetical protein RIR79_1252 [Pseudomonadota bacterium]|jgi:thiol-disulfide isomerase/thioredoxin